VRRFEGLCRFLSEHRDRFDVGPLVPSPSRPVAESRPRAPLHATATRLAEQVVRRLA
jgi:hypothetical protein